MSFLEDYILLDELGQGGFATVYKVRHKSLGYIRAIRVLNQIIARGEEDKTYQKFLRECKILLRLGNGNHPNIVHVYQPLLRAQKAIVEMDFVDGDDLAHYLEKHSGFAPVEDVIKLVSDIGSALAYCHEDIYKYCMDRGEDNLEDDPNDGSRVFIDAATRERLIEKYRVIHNDIHSGNVIRRGNGTYVLLDFGLAIQGAEVIRSSRAVNGAPEYKAPEKWDNESILSPQSDIYSFGVVLYEFLTGRVPFPLKKGKTVSLQDLHNLGTAHKSFSPASIYEVRKVAYESTHPGRLYDKDYPQWLEDLVMKCLAKNPEERFKNGKELHDFVLRHIGSDGYSQQYFELLHENERLTERTKMLESENMRLAKLLAELENSKTPSESAFQTVQSPKPTVEEDSRWVDLGLSVKWAKCNIGALYPEECGHHFAWGEIESIEDGNVYTRLYGKSCGDIGGDADHDVARAKLGPGWRMPRKSDFEELINKCTWTWTSMGDRNGFLITSNINSNTIFLPAGGYLSGNTISKFDLCGLYWSSTPSAEDQDAAYQLTGTPLRTRLDQPVSRDCGCCVRPVRVL